MSYEVVGICILKNRRRTVEATQQMSQSSEEIESALSSSALLDGPKAWHGSYDPTHPGCVHMRSTKCRECTSAGETHTNRTVPRARIEQTSNSATIGPSSERVASRASAQRTYRRLRALSQAGP